MTLTPCFYLKKSCRHMQVLNRMLLENIESSAKIVSLSPAGYGSIIKRLAETGLTGGIVYDALIAMAPKKSKAKRILTLNVKHFKKVWQGHENTLFEP